MNRLVCPRDKIDLGNLFFEGEERSSRTQGGVRGAPHQRNLVRPSTRCAPRMETSSIKVAKSRESKDV